MWIHLKELWRYRELIYTLCYREIVVRYKQSIGGIIWIILKPLSLMGMFTIVFSKIARLPSDGIPYPIFSYCAVLPWTFISTAILNATNSLVNYEYLVQRIYFPREAIPISSVISTFFDYIIASLVFIGLLLVYKIKIGLAILMYPILLVLMILLVIGCSFILSALNVKYRDVSNALPIFIQLWMFASPIIYPMSMVPNKWMKLYKINPIVGILEGFRDIFIKNQLPQWGLLWPGIIISSLLFIFGYIYFKSREKEFADII